MKALSDFTLAQINSRYPVGVKIKDEFGKEYVLVQIKEEGSCYNFVCINPLAGQPLDQESPMLGNQKEHIEVMVSKSVLIYDNEGADMVFETVTI